MRIPITALHAAPTIRFAKMFANSQFLIPPPPSVLQALPTAYCKYVADCSINHNLLPAILHHLKLTL